MKTTSNFNQSLQRISAFTLIELLVIVGVLVTLVGIGVPSFKVFQKESDLDNSIRKVINTLEIAQSKTIASERDSEWGVYFDTSTKPHRYILFKGVDYSSRDVSFDKIYELPQSIEFSDIHLGSNSEVSFSRLTGYASPSGNLTVRFTNDPTRAKIIYITKSGLIGFSVSSVSDTNRVKDSRHIHFEYSRMIDTSTENLTLTFSYDSSTVVKNIVIADNLKEGQIYWDGEVNVNEESQIMKIQTLRLNDLTQGTEFCIHRDRRYNDKALVIGISGDTTGDLIRYSADGTTTQGTSVYVSKPDYQ